MSDEGLQTHAPFTFEGGIEVGNHVIAHMARMQEIKKDVDEAETFGEPNQTRPWVHMLDMARSGILYRNPDYQGEIRRFKSQMNFAKATEPNFSLEREGPEQMQRDLNVRKARIVESKKFNENLKKRELHDQKVSALRSELLRQKKARKK